MFCSFVFHQSPCLLQYDLRLTKTIPWIALPFSHLLLLTIIFVTLSAVTAKFLSQNLRVTPLLEILQCKPNNVITG